MQVLGEHLSFGIVDTGNVTCFPEVSEVSEVIRQGLGKILYRV